MYFTEQFELLHLSQDKLTQPTFTIQSVLGWLSQATQ